MMKTVCALAALLGASAALAQEPTLIRFGRGFAAEEQMWLMSARPDLAPNQGKKYQLKQILFQANPERFQAYLAGELDAGTAPGLAVIFARAQGVDMKVVASICLEAAGSQWFSTTYMVKDDGPIKSAKDLKGGTVGVVGYKTAFVRTPVDIYVKSADWKRDPGARVNVDSLKKLATFMHDKLQWLEKPVNVDEMVDLSYLPR